MRLEGKVCVIAGAAGGLGRGVSEVFAAEGAKLLLVDRDGVRLAETADLLKGSPGQAAVHEADLASAEAVAEIATVVRATYGRCDVLVNTHGYTDVLDTNITETPDEVYDRVLSVNLRSIFLTCKHLIPVMREGGGGSIINVTSTGNLVGWAGAAYCAAKGGLAAMSRQIAHQDAAHGIRCNVIMAGIFDTPMLQVSRQKQGLVGPPAWTGTIERMGRPEEVGYLATFLASDESSFVTASTYSIDGGVTKH